MERADRILGGLLDYGGKGQFEKIDPSREEGPVETLIEPPGSYGPIQMDKGLLVAFGRLRAVALPATRLLLSTRQGRDWAVEVLVQRGVLPTLARLAAVPEALDDPAATLWAGFAHLGAALGMHDTQQAYDDFTKAYPEVVLVGGMFCTALDDEVARRLKHIHAEQGNTYIKMLIASPGGKVDSLTNILNTLGHLKFETVVAAVPGFIASCATMLATTADVIATTPDTQMLFHEMRVINPPSDYASITTLHQYKEIVANMSAKQAAIADRTVQPGWDKMWTNLGKGDRREGFEIWTKIVDGPISTWPQLTPKYKNDKAAVRRMLMVHCPLEAKSGEVIGGDGVLDAIYTLCGNWNDLTLSQSQIVDLFIHRARVSTVVAI